MPATEQKPDEVRGITLRSDFPSRFDSPDPVQMIGAIFEAGGVLTDAAEMLPCSEKTLYDWRSKYPEIDEAARQARQRLVGELRDGMAHVARQHDHKDSYKAKLKLLCMYDTELDWTATEKRIRTDERTTEKEQEERKRLLKEMKDLSDDDLHAKKKAFEELVNGSA